MIIILAEISRVIIYQILFRQSLFNLIDYFLKLSPYGLETKWFTHQSLEVWVIFWALTNQRYIFNIYLTIFKTSDGTILGNRYQASSDWFGVYGLILNGDYIISSIFCSFQDYYLMIYNIPLDSFTYRLFTGSSLDDLEVEAESSR